MEFREPAALKPGDKVAIVSPSAGAPFLFPWVYEQGLDRLKSIFGVQPIEFPTARQSPEFLARYPEARAQDINNAFADPTIKAIIATIGGNDQIRILPYLDKEAISANPKIFMGYSNNTNLHLFLWNLGIISYYGGAIMTQFAMQGGMHEYTIHAIQKALFDPPVGEVYASLEYTDADLDWANKENLNKKRPMYLNKGWIWHNSSDQLIEGRLWGGSLATLNLHLSVRRYLPDFKHLQKTVLFIETSEEMPADSIVYRFIAALGEMDILAHFKAILVAYPKAQFCDKQPPGGRESFIFNQQAAIKQALQHYNVTIPVIFNMNFGHTDPQLIIPSGGIVSINCAKKTIRFI